MNTPATPLDSGRLAVTARDTARMLGISRAQLYRLHSSGRLPLPVYCGTRAPRWVVAELRDWLTAGCPDRQTWERMKGGADERVQLAARQPRPPLSRLRPARLVPDQRRRFRRHPPARRVREAL